ncbi:PREDICTED: pectinesterase inhibitor-like isoform X1 [Camelina sativa]|uniref:Pectinesterase inhibitor-like isoform X1 n=1 Tax=Camelina sativa TaxID=90675 RepID=A0ABM1QXS1_CAMSA|nr:PREDICTED: pectinesterase inhibitor-like isoform X1 [Camelina sativa]
MMIIKFLLLTLLVIISPIWAENDLMINECHNAQAPTTCMGCLESDPTSVHADPVGIAGVVIHCLDSRLNIIINNLTDVSSKEEKAEVKKVLEACKHDLSMEVPKKLSEAKTDLRSGDYDKAARSIMLALGYPWSCRSNLQSVKFDESLFEETLELFSQINIYAQLSDAAMRIIDRF